MYLDILLTQCQFNTPLRKINTYCSILALD